MDYGYVRVSSKEQNEDRQTDALLARGIPLRNLYTDKQSGKDFRRPAYRGLIKRLRQGDRITVLSIDRLGRNYEEILKEWGHITKDIGADIRVLDMPLLDTSREKDLMGTFIADLTLQILSFVAQNERDNIKKRQREGIVAAKARGVRFGRPAKHPPENFAQLVMTLNRGEITMCELAKACDVSESTAYRWLNVWRVAEKVGK